MLDVVANTRNVKQLIQNLRDGEITISRLPAPTPNSSVLLIQTVASLISAGTERMLGEFAQLGLVGKANAHPEKVRLIMEKARTDGIAPTVKAVFRKLDEPLPLGYCNAGVVIGATRSSVSSDVQLGDRVICNGAHAEVVSAPCNLCARIPEGITFDEAAFTVVGAIALQGIRLANPTLGERFMVVGLGLIGQLTVQLLRAHGCQVLGIDLHPARSNLAAQFGAEAVPVGADSVKAAEAWSQGVGVDGVIITASAPTHEIMHQAAQACRKRGRIILVGVVGLNLRRDDFYKKELTFQVSCSYGPGRYDEDYEQHGHDYPLPYVRWTEQRNFEAVLHAMKAGQLNVKPLITHRFQFERALDAYAAIQNDRDALGVILDYPATVDKSSVICVRSAPSSELRAPTQGVQPVVGVIGAGNFANATLLPALVKTRADRSHIGARNPIHAAYSARKFGFEFATTDYSKILENPGVNTVFVLTGHDSHARLVCEALKAGKHVFVEKPLCLNEQELQQIERCYLGEQPSDRPPPASATIPSLAAAEGTIPEGGSPPSALPAATPDLRSPISDLRHLMVGFNRRFSPHTRKIMEWLDGRREPFCMSMTVNAGAIPLDHWTQDPARGGGRIIGEACHFLDLLLFLAGAPITSVSSLMMGEGPIVRSDKMSIQLGFADGSVGTVNYFANGSKSYPKEFLEVFSEGRVIRMENFRSTVGYGFKSKRKFKTWRQDKGHNAEIAAFIDRVAKGGEPLIPFSQLANVTRATFAAMESARGGGVIKL